MTLELEVELKGAKKQSTLMRIEKGHFEDTISAVEKQVKELREEPKLVSSKVEQANKVRFM